MEPQENDDQFFQFPIPSDIIFSSIPIYDNSFLEQQLPEEQHTHYENQINHSQQHRASLPDIHTPFISTTRRHTEGSIAVIPKKKNKTEETVDGSKRKDFLERNRQAALKCRQRKKQWLADLQKRVEFLTTDNEQLQSQATCLKEQVLSLKTLLLAHVDCKVAQSNGTTASVIQAVSSLPNSLNNDNNKNSSTEHFKF